MDYKYPPVYKYIILLILITTFLRYYKVLTKENFLLIAGIFTYMSFVFDYVLIENHPALFYDGSTPEPVQPQSRKVIYIKKGKKPLKHKKRKIRLVRNRDDPMIEDFENEEEYDKQTLDEKFAKEMKELEKESESEDNDSDNLTEEIQKELDELDLE